MSHRVGSAHHAAKVTEDQVKAIRAAHASGKTIEAIRAQFPDVPLTYSSIEKIVYRLSWKHVP
jgi:hypothetical protein